MNRISGMGTSKGMSMGTAYIYKKQALDVKKKLIEDPEEELKKLSEGIEKAAEQIKKVVEKTKISIGVKEAQIFEAHLLILEDEEFISPIQEMITLEKVNAPYAIDQIGRVFQEMFSQMDNPYMQERAADIKDLSQRLIRNVLGVEETLEIPEKAILFCEDLEPSDTAMLDPKKIVGFVTEKGGKTSHSAIIAQSIGIPAMTGISAHKYQILSGDGILLNANENYLIHQPETHLIQAFSDEILKQETEKQKFEAVKHEPGRTKDGVEVEIAANIADSKKAKTAIEQGAEGVGLFRTEFLYMNREALPSVEEQFRAYKEALEAFGDKPMVIRTFDIGGDKQVDYLELEPEMNPFLGYRAIRISLDRVEMFKDQLRALLMASVYGNLKVMFPMISTIQEIKDIKAIIESVKAELELKEIPYKAFDVGIMVEVPVVAVEAEKFAKHVDFFSIGTNDLLQYTVAVDRMSEKLSHLYNWYHPGLLKMIQNVVKAAHQKGIWVGICGEAASDPLLLPVYVAMNVDELSMSGSKISELKWRLSQIDSKECFKHMEAVLEMETAEEVVTYLTAL